MAADNNDNKNQTKKEEENPITYKIGDDFIAVIRELVQLTLLTGTNIVDHLRAVVVEVDPDTGKLIPTFEYIEAYNRMVGDLIKKAEESQTAAMQQNIETHKETAQTAPRPDGLEEFLKEDDNKEEGGVN